MQWMKWALVFTSTTFMSRKRSVEIEKKIEDDQRRKGSSCPFSQRYEEAAQLRDTERTLNDSLERAKAQWEEDSKNKRVTVTVDHVGDVVGMMTGIPVQRIAEKESGRLARMNDDLQGKVIGQDDAIVRVSRAR